jgi:hypothetical protein
MKTDRSRFKVTDHEVSELQGYLGLGMTRQCLALARRLLNRASPTTHAFAETVDAILIQATNPRRWKRSVEAAYARLSEKDQSRVRFQMFSFHVANENWESAERFIPDHSSNATEVLFTMWTLISRRRYSEVRSLYQGLPKAWRTAALLDDGEQDEMDVSALTEALACYHAYMGHWRSAERWWIIGTFLRPFDENAWEGLLKLYTTRALLLSKRAQDRFANDDVQLHEEFPQLFPPPKHQSEANDKVRRFRKYESHLAKVVPEEERFRFNA